MDPRIHMFFKQHMYGPEESVTPPPDVLQQAPSNARTAMDPQLRALLDEHGYARSKQPKGSGDK